MGFDDFGVAPKSYTMVSTFIMIMFVVVFAVILFVIFKNLRTWGKNNKAPLLIVDAKVVGKRMDVSRRNNDMKNTYTSYFITFELESKDRMELKIPDNEYGILIEGDEGKLSFKGTRFVEFKRTN